MQGAFYWYAKYNWLKQAGTFVTPTPVVRRLKRLEKVNIAFIILGPFLFILDFVIWSPSYPILGLGFAAFIYLFAVLEYINYFHIQISYDNLSDLATLRRTKKLKSSSMQKDFRRMK